MLPIRMAEVAAQGIADVDDELFDRRLIQAVGAIERIDPFLARTFREKQIDGRARKPGQEEDDDDDARQRYHAGDQTPPDEGEHRFWLSRLGECPAAVATGHFP